MTQPANTFDQYDAIGNREDLSNTIYDISPTDTPFMNGIGRNVATSVLHEWQTDALAAAGANAQIEGDDAGGDSLSATTRVNNTTQIMDKVVIVSGTQDAVDSAGRSKELAYQLEKASKALKRDIEFNLLLNQAPVTGSSSTARKLRGMPSWYASNVSAGVGGANGSSSTARTDGTQRAITEALLKSVLKSMWDNGGEVNGAMLMVDSFNKQAVSAFTGNANTRSNVDATEKKLVNTIDIYASDFGTLKVVANRFQRARDAHVIDPEMASVSFLRDFKQVPLAKTGDSEKRQLITELTLEVKNEASHGLIADLLTS